MAAPRNAHSTAEACPIPDACLVPSARTHKTAEELTPPVISTTLSFNDRTSAPTEGAGAAMIALVSKKRKRQATQEGKHFR